MKLWSWIVFLVSVCSQSSAEIFSKEPIDQLVPLSSTADVEFKCQADVPDPTYSWRKNMEPIDTSSANSRFKINGGTLTISTPQQSDAGRYQCVMSNVDGKVISNGGNLIFAYIKDFLPSTTSPITTVTGRGIQIECNGADYAPINGPTDILLDRSVAFYWDKTPWDRITPPGTNTQYVSQKTGTLYLATPTEADAAQYSCGMRATWYLQGIPVDKKSASTSLVVQKSAANLDPEFLLQPENTVAILGGNALIECFASGMPTPTLTWLKDDGSLPLNHQITSAGQLLLKNITDDMAGIYSCRAENQQSAITAAATLELQYMPHWTKEISSMTADISTTASLTCKAIGKPVPTLKWYKNGDLLENTEKISIKTVDSESTLQIAHTDDADQGMYQCVASNTHGNVFSSAKLTIQSNSPTFIEKLPDVSKAAEGANTIMVCEVNAAPPANIFWTFENESLIIDNYKYSMGVAGSLQIRNVSKSDQGSYTCKATNMMGTIDKTGYLQIYDPVIVFKSSPNVHAEAGDVGDLSCQESHDSRLNLQWKWSQDGVVIKNANTHYHVSGGALMLTDLTSKQSGTYECCAITEVSRDCATIVVSIDAPPEPPTEVDITTSSETSQHVTWNQPNDNGGEIVEYHVEGKDIYEKEWKTMNTLPIFVNQSECDVIGLLPYVGYHYKISASNKFGNGKPSHMSEVGKTLSGVPTCSPTGLSDGVGILGQLVVQWEPLSPKYYGASSIDYVVAVRKELVGPPVNLPIDLNGTAMPPSNNEPWTEKTVVDEKANQAIFEVNADEIYVPYEAKIKTRNLHGSSPFSGIIIVHTAEIAPDTAPEGLKTDWIRAYSAKVSWPHLLSSNGFTKGYKVQVCNGQDDRTNPKVWRNYTTVDEEPEIVIENLEPNNLYFMKTAGFNTAGLGPWTADKFSFLTEDKPPSNPPLNVKIQLHRRSLSASWKPAQADLYEAAITGYVVQYWFTNDTHKNALDYFTDVNTYKAEFKLPEEGDYTLWVRTQSAGGYGVPSDTFAVTTLAGSKGKYHGGNACANQISFVLVTNVAAMWSILYTLL